MYPKTFGFLTSWARLECIYYISLDGLQRQEAILMMKAKSQSAQTPLTIENIQNPVQPPQIPLVEQKPEQKKGWFHR